MNQRLALLVVTMLTGGLLAACGGATQTTTTTNATSAPAATTSAPAATTSAPAAATSAPAATAASAAAPTAAAAATPAALAPTSAATTAAATRTFKIVPEQTEASYTVQETFLKQNLPFTAVGKTNKVEGEFQFSADGKPTGQITKMTVDLRTLKSDSDRRDNAIRNNWLESEKYPFAEFTSTGVEGVPDSYTEGQEVTFKLLGTMKIRDQTKPVTFDVKGKLQGDTVTGTATTQIMMVDYGFEAPTIAGTISVKDGVVLTINFTAKQAT